jgi:chorismate mutase/prephenate dehydratase
MDMLGHMEDQVIKEGCSILKQICPYYEWLGSYPKADVIDMNG